MYSAIRNVWFDALLQSRNDDGWLVYCKCIRPLGGHLLWALDGMSCARALINYTVFDVVFRIAGLESAGSDRFAISLFVSNPDGT